jgi:hypothetical protein
LLDRDNTGGGFHRSAMEVLNQVDRHVPTKKPPALKKSTIVAPALDGQLCAENFEKFREESYVNSIGVPLDGAGA